jgi:tetratricopeptide (TPR) repeat protein
VGDYAAAEKYYRDALTTFPDYYRACAGLGRVLAARGDLPGAIEQYERATRLLPEPVTLRRLAIFINWPDARKRLPRNTRSANSSRGSAKPKANSTNRQLALFYADHDLKAEEAYQAAQREYAVRRDIHGADALAWTALKAGKLAEGATGEQRRAAFGHARRQAVLSRRDDCACRRE